MIIESKYSKKFVSDSLTKEKFNELYNFALKLRNVKNQLSEIISNDMLSYMEMKPLQFVTYIRNNKSFDIPSSFDKQLYSDVFICYQNKFDAIQKRLKFEQIRYKGCELYKRTTKNHNKGDFKKVITEKKQTSLSICLTYLARYGNVNIVDYINSQLPNCDKKKQEFYNNILRCIDKFGFDRLMNLALQKRKSVITRYSEKSIEFKSLTFRGRSRKGRIIEYNKNYNSVINSFISLSGLGRKSFDIPVRYSKEYHDQMKKYLKKTNDYEYTLTFNEKEHQVNIYLCKDGERYIPQAGDNVVGIDVNCKHNLFALSNESIYDYNRKLVNDFCKLSLEIDKLKESKSYTIGKRKQWKLDTLKRKMIHSEQHMIATMCKELHNQGINHIVMEDLDNGFGKCYVKDTDNEDINYNRKVKFLGISSLKQEVEHIARKYDIAVSTVHSSYTSKMCPICGCIEDENRPNQETFSCIECGYETNADFNAANNIKNRVLLTVLRDTLLKQMDNGAYEPKNLKREKVKEVLLSYRTSHVKDREFNFY